MPDSTDKKKQTGILDDIRLESGPDRLIGYFSDLLTQNPNKAVELLNDDKLNYCSVFLLKSQIEKPAVLSDINERIRQALTLTDMLTAKKRFDSRSWDDSDGSRSSVHSALKWMFVSGSRDDGFSDRYDELMELAAILLVRVLKDTSLLREIVHMIFERNKKGLFTNHLIWSFFEARSPHSLALIVDYLIADDRKDVELAQRLLGFIPGIAEYPAATGIRKAMLYDLANSWLEENADFLRYTGESFHQTCDPIPYTLNMEAKYLCKTVTTEDGNTVEVMTQDETSMLDELNGLDPETMSMLSSCSVRLNRRNPAMWRTWLGYPLLMRIGTARDMKEGRIWS